MKLGIELNFIKIQGMPRLNLDRQRSKAELEQSNCTLIAAMIWKRYADKTIGSITPTPTNETGVSKGPDIEK